MEDNSKYFIIGILILLSASVVALFSSTSYIVNDQVTVALDDNGNLDAFGRLRVSSVTSILDIKHLGDKEPLFVDEVFNGTATATYSNASVLLTTSNDGDYVVRQTFQTGFYQNGKSQQILMTFDNLHPETNIIKRIGYFSSSSVAPYNTGYDGLFLSSESGTVYTNIYKNGTLVEKVAQANWNIDKLDGTGESGYTVNWDKSQIILIDFEWLGVGRVRWSLVIDGQIIQFHETDNANNIDGVYMLSPNHPLRWEIRQTGTGSGVFNTICSTVGTEGSINRLGVERSVNTDSVSISATSTSNKYAVIGIRLDPNNKERVIDVLRFTLLGLSTTNYYWELQLGAELDSPITWVNADDSFVQHFIGSGETVTTDGIVLDSGFSVGKSLSSDSIDNALRLGSFINGQTQNITLVVRPLSNNLDVHGSLTYREVR